MLWIFLVVWNLGIEITRAAELGLAPGAEMTRKQSEPMSKGEVFALMKEIVNKDSPRAEIEKFASLSQETLDDSFANIKMTLREYDKFFEKILNAQIKLPDHTIAFLCTLFGIEYDPDDKADEKYPFAAAFFAKYYHVLSKDPQLTEIFLETIEQLIANNVTALLTNTTLNDYLFVIINPKVSDERKVILINEVFKNIKVLDSMPKFRGLGSKKIKVFSNLFGLQNNWLKNAELILLILKNKDEFKLNNNEVDSLETDFFDHWVLSKIENMLLETVKENQFKANLSRLIISNIGNKLLEEIKQKITEILGDDRIPLEERKDIFQKISFSSLFVINDSFDFIKYNTYYNYIKFSIENFSDHNVSTILEKNKNSIKNLLSKVNFTDEQIGVIEKYVDFSNDIGRSKFEKSNLIWFYDSLKRAWVQSSLIFPRNQTSTSEITDNLNLILSTLYKDNIEKYSKMIFSNLPGIEFEKAAGKRWNYSPNKFSKVIYNQDGYTRDKNGNEITGFPQNRKNYETGPALTVKKGSFIIDTTTPPGSPGLPVENDIPIGYNIHLPKGEIKAVLVDAYGAFGPNNMEMKMSKPGLLISSHHYLRSKGIAVVTTNFLNFLDPDMDVDWSRMSEDLHAKLHASIHKIFESIRGTDSEKLLHGFIPNKPKIYLYGASFGGRTAVRHAELYPNTFDGYISHDGWLSPEMTASCDVASLNKRGTTSASVLAREWLSPMGKEKINFIQQPILLLHNFDDNNVNILVTLAFYQAVLAQNKEKLVSLLITRRGNPIPQTKNNSHNKGHYETEEEQAFKSYIGTIESFIVDGLQKSPTLSQWMVHQYEIFAHKNCGEATFLERFISEAYRLYKEPYYRAMPAGATRTSHLHETLVIDAKKRFEARQKQSLSQPQKIFGTRESKEAIELEAKRMTPKEKSEARKTEEQEAIEEELVPIRPQNQMTFDSFWLNEGRPLYYLMKYLKYLRDNEMDKSNYFGEMYFIANPSVLTDDVVHRALMIQLPNFLDYLRENFYFKLPYDMDLSILANNPELIRDFRSLLLNVKGNFLFTLNQLEALYRGNPELMKERVDQLERGGEFASIVTKDEEKEAKENLRQRILADKNFVVKRLQEMGNLQEYHRNPKTQDDAPVYRRWGFR